jgi:hypothetical protein
MNGSESDKAERFAQVRAELMQTRLKADQSRLESFIARETIRKVEADQARLERIIAFNDASHQEQKKRLLNKLTEAKNEFKRLEIDSNESIEAMKAKIREFESLSDPRSGVENLSDDIPFLLMPVRMETRFKRFGEGESEQYQLWVRIYPDVCSIDTFEPVLSSMEIINAREYWIQIWRSCDDENAKRAAWRSLVGSHGSGRAAWMLSNYEPINIAERPIRPPQPQSMEIILVIPTETPLSAEEARRVAEYWEAIWWADGNKGEEDAINEELGYYLGPNRAAEIKKNYRPVNLLESPPRPWTRSQVEDISVEYLVFPPSAALKTKEYSWTQPARVNIMPDRFVLLGYADNNLIINELGKIIPSPLTVGPDPSATKNPNTGEDKEDNIEVVFSEDLKWIADFPSAVEAGMGFVIELTADQYDRGFDRLLALGVRLASDEKDSQRVLEELIRNHQHSRSGFGLVPQGTPTNNTEQASSGFSFVDDPDASYEDYFKNDSLFVENSDWRKKQDGQWMAEWLGIDPSVLSKARHACCLDQAEARAMNFALWPATLGYFLNTMMTPIFDDNAISQIRWFFNYFVLGRGLVPALHIGQQPYGILPTADFKNLRWPPDWTPFDVIPHPEGYCTFIKNLYELEKSMEQDWTDAKLFDKPAYVGKDGDPHQMLLDIISLHSGSIEYYQRYVEFLEMYSNILDLDGKGKEIFDPHINYMINEMDLLRRIGYSGKGIPEILKMYYLPTPIKLNDPLKTDNRPLVDDRPLSEKETIRAYTANPDKNYIEWLIDSALSSLETIRVERVFKDDKPPSSLLYTMLRHAILLSYYDASIKLHQSASLLTGSALENAKKDPKFIHITKASESESRWKYLYKIEPKITGPGIRLSIAEYISAAVKYQIHTGIKKIPEVNNLAEQIAALDLLKDAKTASLERAFSEHIDCVSYRLDAWKLGLISYRLSLMRFKKGAVRAQQGIFLGMYSWVDNLHPENNLQEIEKPTEALLRLYPDEMGRKKRTREKLDIFRDPGNEGYIHAPSLNQAVTAAVLRNGYLANALPSAPDTMEVNLSSERVRRALSIIGGIRNGQSLAALLGYQFERGLHDSYKIAEVDEFILKFRKIFPLVSGRFESTKVDNEDDIKALEASNVINGLEFINHIKKSGNNKYPFGLDRLCVFSWDEIPGKDEEVLRKFLTQKFRIDWVKTAKIEKFYGKIIRVYSEKNSISLKLNDEKTEVILEIDDGRTNKFEAKMENEGLKIYDTLLPKADNIQHTQQEAINREVDRLLNLNDAVADMVIAESVHQVVQGNYDRTAATVDAYSKGTFPDLPDIVQTPRRGISLTHRIALQLEGDVDPDKSPNSVKMTPRAEAEPAINKWLASVMPELANIACTVTYVTGNKYTATEEENLEKRTEIVTQENLGLQPIDLLYILNPDSKQVMNELDDRIVSYTIDKFKPRADSEITIQYAARLNGKISFFEVSALVKSLRSLILRSRPLRPNDISLKGEAISANDKALIINIKRITLPCTTMHAIVKGLEDDSLTKDTPADQEDIINGIDINIENFVKWALQASSFGLLGAGVGFIYVWKLATISKILTKVDELVKRWKDHLGRYDALIQKSTTLPPDATNEEHINLMRQAENLISTQLTVLSTNPPLDPKIYENILAGERAQFIARMGEFEAILKEDPKLILDLYKSVKKILLIDKFDNIVFDLSSEKSEIERFAKDLVNRARNLKSELDIRASNAENQISLSNEVSDAELQVQILTKAVKIMFGESFQIVPEFSLISEQADEWEKAYNDSKGLLQYLTNKAEGFPGIDFPVDNWLYGIARVREKMHHWENIIFLANAFGRKEPNLIPVQFPYKADDSWLALQYPPDTKLDGERLLYTAYYAADKFSKGEHQCGLLIDEWTETIPSSDEITGVAFHYDRPNNEAPQAFLLVTPTSAGEKWKWDDIVGALHETLHMAVLRAIEPDHIDESGKEWDYSLKYFHDNKCKVGYAQFLPATMMAATLYDITISANLSANDQVFQILRRENNG